MFVRGDDVAWGLMHARHHTVAFPGIALWHDGFEGKTGPVSWFYETRNLALIGCLAVPGYSWRDLLLRYLNQCSRSLFGLQYVAASHITWAMQEFLAGPSHWMAVDQPALHSAVMAFDGERVSALSTELQRVPDLPHREGAPRVASALASLLVLGGHLLPGRFDRKPLGGLQLGERALGAAPGHAAILYRGSRPHLRVRGPARPIALRASLRRHGEHGVAHPVRLLPGAPRLSRRVSADGQRRVLGVAVRPLPRGQRSVRASSTRRAKFGICALSCSKLPSATSSPASR